MRLFKMIFFLMFGLLLLPACEQKQVSNSSNILVIDETHYNAGTIHKNKHQLFQHEFTLLNQGRRPIKIKKIDVSCSCVKTKLSSNTINPSQESALLVSMDLSNIHGMFSKTIYVNSDAQNDVQLIRISGRIVE